MKTIEEIKKNKRIAIVDEAPDGCRGIISMPTWKGSVICSTGAGWEHISVSPEKLRITPSWDDMCKIKDIFWHRDEDVIQIHPKERYYVNNLPNCLHLWRCTYKEMVLPPSILVGIRQGQTREQIIEETKEAYAMAGESF